MNRRRFLLALAAVVPVAVFFAARQAASWRPMAIAHFAKSDYPSVEVNDSMIAVNGVRLDLNGLKRGPLLPGTMLGVGDWNWQLNTRRNEGDVAAISLNDGAGHTRNYALPGFGGEWDVMAGGFIRPRYTPAADRLEVVSNSWYYRWQWSSRRLERHLEVSSGSAMALSPDGETLTDVDNDEVVTFSTRTGRKLRTLALKVGANYNTPRISDSGRYMVCQKSAPVTTMVVDTRTGRALLSVVSENADAIVFSPDETRVAVPLAQSKLWQIRDLPTSQLLRTLPFVPNVEAGAFSPDGATLYSVAGNVLYRQRAK